MFKRAVLLLVAALAPVRAQAGLCDAPAVAAEQAYGIPPRLLQAVGVAESGRSDGLGRAEAWPWSVDAQGRDYALASAAEAVALVASLRARGVQSIDVGCFQMNLFYHPHAFTTLEEAFDPARNAMEAARFLRQLRDAAPGWEDAVARYHSASPWLGQPYMRRVMAIWTGGPSPALGMEPAPSLRVPVGVRVYVPGNAADWRPGAPASRLPVVFTPSRLNQP